MRIIQPIPVTPAILTSSNVPETDATAWTAGTYTLGTTRMYDHRVYEVIVSSTTDRPDIGAVATPPTWLDLGATNRYKMFDQIISTQTSAAIVDWGFEVVVTPGTIINALALFGMEDVLNVTVEMTDPIEGVVYSETVSLIDNSEVTDWYAYFFSDIIYSGDAIFDDLPSYGTASLSVTFEGTTGVGSSVGEMVIGKTKDLGVTNFGTSVSIQDYSIKSRDDFGNVVITQRAFSKRADFDVTVDTSKVSAVQNALAAIRTVPTVFIGDPDRPETVVYGFYKSFNIVLSSPSISDCTIEVEGLT